ncbi:MAG: sortase [Chloroflexi bacterium]|nr:sortase [Chloroflexota bacterium]
MASRKKQIRSFSITLVLVATLFSATGILAASSWVNVGSPGFSAGKAFYTSLAFDGSTPYVAYQDAANGYKATVMKFDGTNWVNVGSVGFSAGSALYTSLAFNGTGAPYVAYRDVANSNKATVMKFDGTNWVNVGSVGFSAGGVSDTSLAFDGNTPYLAYQDQGNGDKVTVMKFDGTNWVNLDSAGFSAGAVFYTSLALDGSTPYLAYQDGANSNKATVMKFDGTNWVHVGSASFSTEGTLYTSLAFDGSTPYLAFGDAANSDKATVMKLLPSIPTVVFGAKTIPANGASLTTGPTQIFIEFDEDVTTATAEDEANYLLVEAGSNGTFDTTSCAVPGSDTAAPDDVKISVDTATYDNSAPFISTLNINGGTALPDGTYRLFICGTTSIEVADGTHLNNGVDSTLDFSIIAAASNLPATGFRHGEITQLPKQPAAKAYTETAMTLKIPKLSVNMPIVGVPQSANGWDVTWLGNGAGYLAGSAFPTWAGNTVITGHVWDAFNQPGAFAEIKSLGYGDQVQIQAWGQTYTYEVRESKLVTVKNVDAAFQSEEYDWLTLVTCEFYNPFSGEYLFRRSVRAVLVSVE